MHMHVCLFVSLCLCGVCMWMCSWTGVCVCSSMWKPDIDVNHLPLWLFTFVFEIKCWVNLELIDLGRSDDQQAPWVLLFCGCRVPDSCSYTQLFDGLLGIQAQVFMLLTWSALPFTSNPSHHFTCWHYKNNPGHVSAQVQKNYRFCLFTPVPLC